MIRTAKATDIAGIDPATVTVIPRSDTDIMGAVTFAGSGGHTYMLGYRKADGSFRVMHAKSRVVKPFAHQAVPSDPKHQETREEHGLILVYDVDVANKVRAEVAKDSAYLAMPGVTEEEGAAKARYLESKLKASYRSIYPNRIEMVRGAGRTWVVEGSEHPEIRQLEQAARASAPAAAEPAPQQSWLPATETQPEPIPATVAGRNWFERYLRAGE